MKAPPKEAKVAKTPEMPPLCDPKGNRQVKEVVPPVHRPLTAALLYTTGMVGKRP